MLVFRGLNPDPPLRLLQNMQHHHQQNSYSDELAIFNSHLLQGKGLLLIQTSACDFSLEGQCLFLLLQQMEGCAGNFISAILCRFHSHQTQYCSYGMGRWNCGSILGRSKSSPQLPAQLSDTPSHINSGSFHGVKKPEREADHSPRSTTYVKNMWNYTSTSKFFMAWCSIKHKDNFTFICLLMTQDCQTVPCLDSYSTRFILLQV
jgi:hypothetical protein